MAVLKTATAACHERIEVRFDLDARLRSPTTYADLLERMLGFYRPVEERIAPYAAALPGLDWPGRRKVPLLLADLGAVGRAPGAPQAVAPLPAVGSADDALGVLYVLEGATLGGTLIARAARARLGVTPVTGCAFFTAYGSATAARWRAFAAILQTATAGAPSGATLAAATACFTGLEAGLCDPSS
jgi:heme oxygenase (biliverdin-IX-beta and delta-forming)